MTDQCPICLNAFTTSESHRPVALSCGHLFGFQCINQWFGNKKTALCPTCTAKCRSKQNRLIWATSVTADKNVELTDKVLNLQNKNQTLQLQLSQLRSTIDLLHQQIANLKSENKRNEQTRTKSPQVFDLSQLSQLHRVNLPHKHSDTHIFIYDASTNSILLTFHDSTHFGIKKYEIFDLSKSEILWKVKYNELILQNSIESQVGGNSSNNYNSNQRSSNSSHIFSIKIKDLKSHDTCILFCYNKTVILLNTHTKSLLLSLSFSNPIVSIEFDKNKKKLIYAGDSTGHLYFIDLNNKTMRTEKICNLPIHSIFMKKTEENKTKELFVGTLTGIYHIEEQKTEDIADYDEFNSDQSIPENNLNFNINNILSIKTVLNVFGDDKNAIATVRQSDCSLVHIFINYAHKQDINIENEITEISTENTTENRTVHALHNSFNKIFHNFKETKRLKFLIKNEILFVINNEIGSVVLYDKNGNVMNEYHIGEKIVGICTSEKELFVLNEKGIAVYG